MSSRSSGFYSYIAKRLLWMIPTLLGITVVVFTLIQFVPGGPVEQAMAQLKGAGSDISSQGIGDKGISQDELQIIREYYGFDKPAVQRYLEWLGKVLRFDLGESYLHQRPVWDVVQERFPVSLFFGLVSFVLSYVICVPLGVWKAIRNNTRFDAISSGIIFAGYVIPGYALGLLLIIFFAGGSYLDWFPISGFVSEDFEELGFFAKIGDMLHHMFLPMLCYMAGEFAFLTLLMKNSILEEIKKEYMRTALVKGATFRQAIWKHALRNALLPIATRLGEITTLIFAGALLIEKVFDIDGMGLLAYDSIVSRDYNVVMGIILLSSFLTLLGRLLSDILYRWVDPRIQFD
jgi:microcin C transport system permease protein